MFNHDACRQLSVSNMVVKQTSTESKRPVSAIDKIGHKLLQLPNIHIFFPFNVNKYLKMTSKLGTLPNLEIFLLISVNRKF